MIDNNKYIIKKYKEFEKFIIQTTTKDKYIFKTSFIIRKIKLRDKYYIRYIEYSKSPTTIWGMKATIAKWWFKKQIKNNIKLIKIELKKIILFELELKLIIIMLILISKNML